MSVPLAHPLGSQPLGGLTHLPSHLPAPQPGIHVPLCHPGHREREEKREPTKGTHNRAAGREPTPTRRTLDYGATEGPPGSHDINRAPPGPAQGPLGLPGPPASVSPAGCLPFLLHRWTPLVASAGFSFRLAAGLTPRVPPRCHRTPGSPAPPPPATSRPGTPGATQVPPHPGGPRPPPPAQRRTSTPGATQVPPHPGVPPLLLVSRFRNPQGSRKTQGVRAPAGPLSRTPSRTPPKPRSILHVE